eukprot:6647647-Pyramimonas_sp.AAC.1
MPIFVVPRRSILHQVTEVHPTVERLGRGDVVREPMRDTISVKRLVPSGCSEPLRAIALVPTIR